MGTYAPSVPSGGLDLCASPHTWPHSRHHHQITSAFTTIGSKLCLRQRLHSRVKDEDFSSIAHAATAEPRIRNAANCSPPVEKCRQRVVDDFFIEWMFE